MGDGMGMERSLEEGVPMGGEARNGGEDQDA